MKKILVIFLFTGILFGALEVIRVKVGDLRPVLFPASKPKISPIPVAFGKPLDISINTAEGFEVGYFVEQVGPVRDLAFSPGGVLLASIPNEGKIVMFPDRNKDGIADEVAPVVAGLQKPHGIEFYDGYLYVVEETKVSRYIWRDQKLIGGVARLEKKLFDLPKGDRHVTRSIVFDNEGIMYISIGSSCDACVEKHPYLASVIISDTEGKTPEVYARGLRNAPFITIHPVTQELWGTEMGRDFLGDNLPPDEINIIRNRADYGWPYCYGAQIFDTHFKNKAVADCTGTEKPIFEIPAHSAPLGLRFIHSKQFPEEWQGDLLVAYHGSWNRSTPTGYKVVRLDVENNTVNKQEDFITGFLNKNSAAARPVDLEFDQDGHLFISDDKGGNIFVVTKKE